MFSIFANTNRGRILVARGDPLQGFYFEGALCHMEFVFQQIERCGFTFDIRVEDTDSQINSRTFRIPWEVYIAVSRK